MGHPEPLATIDRPPASRRSRAAPHRHGPGTQDLPDGPETTLIALSLAVQDGCERCVQYHAAAAGHMRVARLQLLESLATALLLSTPQAERWPRLAEVALHAHAQGTP